MPLLYYENKARAEGKFDEIEESWIYGIQVKPDLTGAIGEPVLFRERPLVRNLWWKDMADKEKRDD